MNDELYLLDTNTNTFEENTVITTLSYSLILVACIVAQERNYRSLWSENGVYSDKASVTLNANALPPVSLWIS